MIHPFTQRLRSAATHLSRIVHRISGLLRRLPHPRKILFWMLRILPLLITIWMGAVLLLAVSIHVYGNQERADEADVIVVLGAGVRRDGSPGWALSRRTRHAADLWHEGKAEHLICTGAQPDNRPNSEAVACFNLLVQLGVSADAISLEERSRSTEENAIYTRQIMEENGWQDALVVSDSYHVLRAHYIFQTKGITLTTAPVPSNRIPSRSFYANSIVREIAALHWQVVKETLNLPVTHLAGV